MKLIWTTKFWCSACNKDVPGRVYSPIGDRDDLSEEEKNEAVEWLQHYHARDVHTNCHLCGRNIKPHEEFDILWNEQESVWKNICLECGKKNVK